MARIDWRALAAENDRVARLRKGTVVAPAPTPVVVVRRGPPICVECTAHSWSFDWMTGKVRHRCHEPMTKNPVTGEATDPMANRRDKLSCGPQAQFFHAKPPAPSREREVRQIEGEPLEFVPPVPVRFLGTPARDEVVAVLWERP